MNKNIIDKINKIKKSEQNNEEVIFDIVVKEVGQEKLEYMEKILPYGIKFYDILTVICRDINCNIVDVFEKYSIEQLINIVSKVEIDINDYIKNAIEYKMS